jgi:quercetin dioxygenase-like cupin family protein
MRKLLLDCVLLKPELVERVELREITLPGGVPIGAHRHPCPVFGQILSGRILFQVQGEPSRELGPGDPFHEPADTPILHFDAIDHSATFLGLFSAWRR